MTDFVRLVGLSKSYGGDFAVRDLSLSIPRGSIVALLGPSGSGKTTTLRLMAGFEDLDSGQIMIGGKEVSHLTPAARGIGMVFQHYALFPHLTVAENIAFGISERAAEERAARIAEMLDLVDLPGFGDREITSLSGGQQQRIAVARALAPSPDVLLLDEPLSNLDPALRERTRTELRRALKEVGITSVFVTHEQEEAFALGDLVAVMKDGELQQVGPPPELYENPVNLFVATFVGRGSRLRGLAGPDGTLDVAGDSWSYRSPDQIAQGEVVDVLVRPESLRFVESGGIPGEVEDVRYSGARAYYRTLTEIGPVEVEARAHATEPGERVRLSARACHAFKPVA